MTGSPVNGAAKRLRGSVTEALGKLSGDEVAQAEGAAQKREGAAEERAALPPRSAPPDKTPP